MTNINSNNNNSQNSKELLDSQLMDCSEKTHLIDSINYLIYLKNPWKLSSSNPAETISCLAKINEINFKYTNTFECLSDEKKMDFIELLFDYIKYMHERLNENLQKDGNAIPIHHTSSTLSKAKSLLEGSPSKEATQAQMISNELEILYKMCLCTWSWADKSSDFCHKLHEMRVVRVIFKYFANQALIGNLLEQVRINNNYFKLGLVYRALIGSVHNLSRYSSNYSAEWANSSCFHNLLHVAEQFNLKYPNLDVQLIAYFAIVNLYNKQTHKLDQLTGLKEVIKRVVELVRLCSTKLALNDNLQRRVYCIEDAKSSSNPNGWVEILVVNSRDIVWRLTELINFLIRLVDISNKLKLEIYEQDSLGVYLNRILFNGNSVEKEHVLKLIWKLTGEPRVANSIKQDVDLFSYVIGLSLNTHNKNKNLVRYANYILFALNSSSDQVCRHNSIKKVSYQTKSSTLYETDPNGVSVKKHLHSQQVYAVSQTPDIECMKI